MKWLALLLLLAGCASYRGIDPRSSPVDAATLEAGKSLAGHDTAAWPELDWWKRFGDPQLDRLVEEGLAGSANIRRVHAVHPVLRCRPNIQRPCSGRLPHRYCDA